MWGGRLQSRLRGDLGRRAFRADVVELLVHPVARVALGDDLLEAARAQGPLLGLHGQGAIDLVGLLLDVEGVDGEGAVAELLVGARVLRSVPRRRRGC